VAFKEAFKISFQY